MYLALYIGDWTHNVTDFKNDAANLCDECKCELDIVFTDIHKMRKTNGRKVVCGMCAAKLEQQGWREIARAK